MTSYDHRKIQRTQEYSNGSSLFFLCSFDGVHAAGAVVSVGVLLERHIYISPLLDFSSSSCRKASLF
jgi:hypothetical protein